MTGIVLTADQLPYMKSFSGEQLGRPADASESGHQAHAAKASGMGLDTTPEERMALLKDLAAGRHEDLMGHVRERIRSALNADPGSTDIQLQSIARQMHVSGRTLKRRLRASGSTYRAVLAQVRLEMAMQMLNSTSWPISRIAAQLGYSSATNLSRAFSRWSGSTPGRIRKEGITLFQLDKRVPLVSPE